MFDIGWSELLIFAVVTLIFVGPKELPAFLNTIGRYVGMIRRQAEEFRGYFDSAMKEADLDKMRDEFETVGRDVEGGLRRAEESAAEIMTGPLAAEKSATDHDPSPVPKSKASSNSRQDNASDNDAAAPDAKPDVKES